jgi:predicted dehydrogenase
MDKVGIGVVGCGVISGAYLKAASTFPILDIRALADIKPQAARARAEEFGLRAVSVDDLLSDPSIEIVLNLTIPKAHAQVTMRALDAGKHVHSEKPIGITTAEARPLVAKAKRKGLRLGCAPDTFLGGAHQTCRKLIDEGKIGTPIAGTAFFMCPGHERWHPAPAFYYQPGAGPMLDMGPYYITALVNMLGPVARVSGATSSLRKERLITSEPLKGTHIAVEIATHVAGTLEFASGAIVSIVTSFDVPRHRHRWIEVYGSEGSLAVPDPNYFGSPIEFATATEDWRQLPTEHIYADGNYRIIGVADMAHAIRKGRPHRASGELAFHVLEVMQALQQSSDSGRHIKIKSQPSRPAMLPTNLVKGELD